MHKDSTQYYPMQHQGFRVIYYYVNRRGRIYLVLVYAKNVKDDLTRAEENQLREFARQLEGEE